MLLLWPFGLAAQTGKEEPKSRAAHWLERSAAVMFSNPDSGQWYAEKALPLAAVADNRAEVGLAESRVGFALLRKGRAGLALDHFNRALVE